MGNTFTFTISNVGIATGLIDSMVQVTSFHRIFVSDEFNDVVDFTDLVGKTLTIANATNTGYDTSTTIQAQGESGGLRFVDINRLEGNRVLGIDGIVPAANSIITLDSAIAQFDATDVDGKVITVAGCVQSAWNTTWTITSSTSTTLTIIGGSGNDQEFSDSPGTVTISLDLLDELSSPADYSIANIPLDDGTVIKLE